MVPGLTPLHCATMAHGVLMKGLNSSGGGVAAQADVSLQSKAAETFSCLEMLLNAGANLTSQVGASTKRFINLTSQKGGSTERSKRKQSVLRAEQMSVVHTNGLFFLKRLVLEYVTQQATEIYSSYP